MIRTLTNAIESGRLAHAFILTGVRGVGKTTTARIIARALNCIGPDGDGGPTPDPCGVCANCTAIAEDRHVDVLEMDAASRTGVDDIRELIDGVRYRPTSARYKVYIIDEVHMLSKNAFNALLKTLEEPPEHVKFIFATTETRKVPVTVLSRCQRFDLRRVEMETLAAHFRSIAEKEGATIADEALHLIVRAADGSVRDGLSLLDQAIAHTGGEVGEDQVRDMLGLADRTLTFDLLQSVMGGDIQAALQSMTEQYQSGADPVVILQDLLELTHWLTRIKVVPEAAEAPGVPEAERVRGRDMADRLSMAAVSRAWQMLLKGLGEARTAPSPMQAAEMVLVRLAYASDLPSPADAIKALDKDGQAPASPAPSSQSSAPQSSAPQASTAPASTGPEAEAAAYAPAPEAAPAPSPDSGQPRAALAGGDSTPTAIPEASPQPVEQAEPVEQAKADPQNFPDVVALTDRANERQLHANLKHNVHLVHFELGKIEVRVNEMAPKTLTRDLVNFLNDHTVRSWLVSVASHESGAPTLAQQEEEQAAADKRQAAGHPAVKAVLDAFPGSHVEDVRPLVPPEPDAVPDLESSEED